MSQSHTSEVKIINIETWIEENKKNFLPPICHKVSYLINLI